MNETKHILLITTPFRPNVGGVETHLDDLITSGVKRNINFSILTYQPLVSNSRGKTIEKETGFTVYRIPWIKMNLFHLLEHYPIFEFLYLFPALFICGIVLLIMKHKNITTIHSQGLVAGAVGIFLGKIFKKPVIISTHSIYNFPKNGLYKSFVLFLFKNAKHVLTLSKQSESEVKSLGIQNDKVSTFTYWVNQKIFLPKSKSIIRKKFKLPINGFICLFVGRLVEVKGVFELLESAKNSPKVFFLIVGDGPLHREVSQVAKKEKNILFAGRVDNNLLPDYYNAADVLIVPSTHEEGYGRVILESLSCGIPVIGSNRGGIKEFLIKDVGILIDISEENISRVLEEVRVNNKLLKNMSKNAIVYAKKMFSEQNIEQIINYYE